jgi:predicted dehydrogenase
VLCEKPLVSSPAELARVAGAAAARGRVLHTVHNWHHAPIIRRAAELVSEGVIGRVRRVVWQTLRTRPAAARDAGAPNWRVDPAIAGGGVLTDHGWHVFYVLRRWLGHDPVAVSARLERRRHLESPVEDTAEVHVAFADASAEILLTWAADSRGNHVELSGTEGVLRLEDDTLVLARSHRGEVVRRWPCPPALSDGSQHPDWFAPVVDDFLAEIDGSMPGPARSAAARSADDNLAEASLCVALESAARESSRRGGPMLPVAPARSAARGPAA